VSFPSISRVLRFAADLAASPYAFDAHPKSAGNVVDILEGFALQQVGVIAVEKYTSFLEVIGEAVSKPHVLALSLLPRAKRVAAEPRDCNETEMR
jgi:hypothetical protein